MKQTNRKKNVKTKKAKHISKPSKKREDLYRKLTSLHAHASQLGSAKNVDEIIKHAMDAMEFALGFDFACMMLVEQGCLRIKGARGVELTFSELPLTGRGVTARAARKKASIRVPDTRKEDAYVDHKGLEWTGRPSMLSELAVPVILHNETTAVLDVESTGLNAFTEDDQKLLEILASHILSSLSRLQSEQSLRQSEAKMRGVLDALPDLVFELSSDGVFTDYHAATRSDLAYDPEAFLGKSVRHILPSWLADSVEAAMATARKTGIIQTIEYRLPKLDGTMREWEARIVLTSTGNFVDVVRDITQRRQAEENLRRSEERYRSLFDRMQDGIYLSTHEGRFVEINPAFVKMFGYSSKQEMLDIADIKKELYFSAEERGSHILDTGREEVVIYRMRRKDGSEIWVEDHGRYIHDENGKIIFHEGLLRDVTDRKLTEEKLKESEEKYRALVENSSNLIGILQDGVLKYVNGTFSERLGWTIEEVTDSSFNPVDKIVAERFRPMVIKNISKRLRGEHIPPYEISVITRLGSELPTMVRAERITYHGKPADAFTFVDISDRKRIEDTIRRRAEELAALQETVLDITLAQAKLSSLLEAIVKRAVQLLGARSGGLYLCDPLKREATYVVSFDIPQDYRGVVLKYGEGVAGRVAETGKPIIIDDYRIWDGRAPTYEKDRPFGAVLGVPMIWQGQVTGVIDVVDEPAVRRFTQSDLELLTLFANHAAIAVEHARLLAQVEQHADELEQLVNERTRSLQQSEAKYRQLVELAQEGVWVIDKDAYTTFVNPRMAEMLGYAREEMIGKHLFSFMDEGGVELAKLNLERRRQGIREQIDFPFLRKDGTRIYTFLSTNPITDEKGEYVGALAVVADITERKRLEEQLAESERLAAIGQTAAMVGHDLRNPLQAISSATYVLKKTLTQPIDEQTEEMIGAIEDSVRYSDRIVSDLLEFSGEIRLENSETNVKSLLNNALLQVEIPKNISVSDSTSDNPKILVDAEKIRRVFVNLVENAIDAMPTGGKLKISGNKAGNTLEVKFTDTGVGIPESVMRELWKPLITTKSKGIGLGLAICKRIAEAHGGSISVDSKAGAGTTFTLTIPIAASQGGKGT